MKFKPSKSLSAAELMNRLQSDPNWVRKNAEREAKREVATQQMREEVRPEETPLLNDLAAAGVKVSSVWDLVNAKWNYPAAIPILTEYLQRVHHPVLREGIARALTVPEARGIAGQIILRELRKSELHKIRWVLANAMTVLADSTIVDEIRGLLEDDKYADVRERLTVALETATAS